MASERVIGRVGEVISCVHLRSLQRDGRDVHEAVRLGNGKLAEHWDVIKDEVKKEASRSGLPMFGDKFPA